MTYSPAGLTTTYQPPSYSSAIQEVPTRASTKDVEDAPDSAATKENSPLSATLKTKVGQNRKRLVFQDPVAFRYLEEDPATDVIGRWKTLQGYEMYLVEQWACSRTHPTFLICTYTGDPSHTILVNVLSAPSDESSWSPRLQIYFQAVSQFHAKEKDTPLGTLMVTNLSNFPSTLTVIAIPDGNVRKHREDFIVNENLKRMGCSGRAAINVQPPQPSTIAKYHHLYRTSEAVPLYQSVMELVRICQTALVMYDKLQPTYADGLLCDVTEKAISDWWTDIGTYFYNVEPSDGVLGPTTVAALLGLLLGAYNRLKVFGSPVGKEVLDTVSMKRAIGHFQKGQKVERTRRLDRETLDRLHRATAKSAAGEGWNAAKAVKSTVAELSGKGGEMVMGIVGSRDKVGISDAETMDIEIFSQVVTGPRMKWLWQGKPVKSADMFSKPTDDLNGRIFSTDDQGNFLWTSNHHDSLDGGVLERTDTSLTTQTQEIKSSRNRIRGAVPGLKPHVHRTTTNEAHAEWVESATAAEQMALRDPYFHNRDHSLRPPLISQPSGPTALDMALLEAEAKSPKKTREQLRRTTTDYEKRLPGHREQLRPALQGDSPRRRKVNSELADIRNEFKADIYRNFSADLPYKGFTSKALRRSASAVHIQMRQGPNPRTERINRQLSFSLVENAVSDFGEKVLDDRVPAGPIEGDLTNALAERDAVVAGAIRKANRIQRIQQGLIPYTEDRVAHVEHLDHLAHEHLNQLNEMYYQRLDDYQAHQATSSDVVSHEKSGLTESFRRVEMLGAKLDYELDALQSRMQEAEDGVNDFERNVVAIEAKIKKLIGDEKPSSEPWYQRLLSSLATRKETATYDDSEQVITDG
ncbi:hypothetical protein PV10_00690 [Exophiala mesophila]|uniref:STB6-like N-terminal domain-containing protein n=1 Tax=Exophiala mesophila TaxID=212818 RepID=A0A0D1Y804_EXOME|nr:uncharacterized protein PV10_00690 [Exophiala mesophila]KIV96876.1 hypothetical protein PV10_00690 [Exophiala mesophila]